MIKIQYSFSRFCLIILIHEIVCVYSCNLEQALKSSNLVCKTEENQRGSELSNRNLKG